MLKMIINNMFYQVILGIDLILMVSVWPLARNAGSYCPQIVNRTEWGARKSKSVNLMTLPGTYAFIHHTVIPTECYTKADCIMKIRGIQDYHMDTHGWDDIGYSFLIGDDGNVYEGRGWNRVGAHTKGYNSQGQGFGIIGNFMEKLPSATTLSIVKNLLKCGVAKGKLNSNYILRGHRDMRKGTTCPGDSLYAEIKRWLHY